MVYEDMLFKYKVKICTVGGSRTTDIILSFKSLEINSVHELIDSRVDIFDMVQSWTIESVVQYIGRQDIKGNKIFHKDKLRHSDGTECYVSWSDKYCQFCLCKPHTNILIQKYDSPWVTTWIEEFEIIEEFSSE